VTLAPELPGASAVVQRLVNAGVVVAAGHTAATADAMHRAAEAGVTLLTHAFNAMAALHHREPGAVGAALLDERIRVSLIADGVHLHPDMVRLIWKLVGSGRLVLVSDATAALDAPQGRQRLGEVDLLVDGDCVRNLAGTLAGTNLSLLRALNNLMQWTETPLHEALPTVTTTPARALGLAPPRIAVGASADLVLLSPGPTGLEVRATYVGGCLAYSADPTAAVSSANPSNSGTPRHEPAEPPGEPAAPRPNEGAQTWKS
jgi:N-acetylglucosamine-6-phosphate deacetylase